MNFLQLFIFTLFINFSSFSWAQPVASKICTMECSQEEQSKKSDQPVLDLLHQLNLTQGVDKAQCKILPQESLAVLGARKVMATTYASCDVLKLPVRSLIEPDKIKPALKSVSLKEYDVEVIKRVVAAGTLQNVLASHPYLASQLQSQAGSLCTNLKECTKKKIPSLQTCQKLSCETILNPPLYQFAGKSFDSAVVPRQQTKQGNFSGMDCSYFISKSFSSMGLKFFPNKSEPKGGYGTVDFVKFGSTSKNKKPADCFDRVGSEVGIKPGDVMVAMKNHMVMIDTVGADAFGIQAIIESVPVPSEPQTPLVLNKLIENTCDQKLDIQNFKITIAHSSPHGNSVGVQRETASEGLEGPLKTALILKAKHDCIEQLRANWAIKFSQLTETKSPFVTRYEALQNSAVSTKIIRHQPDRNGCKGPAPVDQTLACSDCCDLNASYESLTQKGANP